MSWWRKGPKESSLEDWARLRAHELGLLFVKISPTLGVKYWPDRLVAHPDAPPAFLELKRFGDEPTEEQFTILNQLADEGYLTGWADTKPLIEAFFQRVLGARRRPKRGAR